MKVSDYIVNFLIEKRVKDVFGYPGGMVTHLMDSFSKYEGYINTHVCYHEQAAALAACANAQISGNIGVAYATSGPGATNLITGICNAFFDSVPVLFITGQVNTFESKKQYQIRQRGFQETDIVWMVKKVTKYSAYVENAENIRYYLEKAYKMAMQGRKGPVLLDIPMNIQREEVVPETLKKYDADVPAHTNRDYSEIISQLKQAQRPCIVLGAGCRTIPQNRLEAFAEYMQLPVVTSMLSVGLLPDSNPFRFGFIGAYGDRTANFVVAKSDLLLCLGCRLDVRQVGGKRENFAPNAKIIRIDIDPGELSYKIRENEMGICAYVEDVLSFLMEDGSFDGKIYADWLKICRHISTKLTGIDLQKCNLYIEKLSSYIPENTVITTDVGQNQVWVAQSFKVKRKQKLLFSGGHGAMGYSLPASIGAYYAEKRPVVSFNGDGGIQMNIQELEFVRREKIPIKIIVFNNNALGMIRHFQEMYFQNNYTQTIGGKGYSSPDFEKIAEAYGIKYIRYNDVEDINDMFMKTEGAVLAEIVLHEDTYVFPKLEFGKPNQDQEPLLDRELFSELMEL